MIFLFRLDLECTRKFTNDFNIEYIIELLDRIDTGAALAVAVFVGDIKYVYLCVIALARFITAGAILFPITFLARIISRGRSPPVDSKRKILN